MQYVRKFKAREDHVGTVRLELAGNVVLIPWDPNEESNQAKFGPIWLILHIVSKLLPSDLLRLTSHRT